MHGGKRQGSGRKRGARNKLTAALCAKLAAAGKLPLEFMLERMRDESEDHAVRKEMAKAAAPYCHPKLQAIQHTGDEATPIQRTITVKLVSPKSQQLNATETATRQHTITFAKGI